MVSLLVIFCIRQREKGADLKTTCYAGGSKKATPIRWACKRKTFVI